VDYTSRTNFRIPSASVGIIAADYDRDGKVDLYIARTGTKFNSSWVGGTTINHEGNILLRNLGNWKFEDVTKKSGTWGGGRTTFSAAWFDANNDGWPDLYVIHEFGNGVLLVNQKDGTFREVPLTKEPCDFGSMGLVAGDIDNDDRIDLYLCNMFSKAGLRVIGNIPPEAYPKDVLATIRRFPVGSQLHHNLGGLRFEQLGESLQVHDVGWAYGAALVDLDNDGWLDIFATCGYMSHNRDEPDG
jgi:hypothetical protein